MSLEQFDPSELYKQSPPAFGHAMLKYYGFEEGLINLNNGSYGAVPLPVQHAINKLTTKVEGNPDVYLRIGYYEQLLDVRRKVAQLIGADVDEVVLVQNSSMGINTVLRNLVWEKGDTIITFSTSYPAASATAQYIADTPPHPTHVKISLQYPTTHAAIIEKFKGTLASITRAEGKKVVAVIDSLHSLPGVLLPWKELVAICKEQGILSVIDAAHSIGQEQNINLTEAGPDFWFTNCHKWFSSKRPSGALYVPKRNHHLMNSSIPTSTAYVPTSNRKGELSQFAAQHAWVSSLDPVHYMSVGYALDFRNWVGGEKKINDYCHDLALKGGKRLAEVLGTTVMDPDGELTVNMVNVELPLSSDIKPSREVNQAFLEQLLEVHKKTGFVYFHNDRWWIRCSAQIWNELSDFEKLGEALLIVCKELDGKFGTSSAA